jgi:WD40 repeat protein/serine/threonine protein kinase
MDPSLLAEEEIFHIAHGISSPELRAVYLKQVCGDDIQLRCRVEALVSAHGEEHSFLERPASGLAQALEANRDVLAAGLAATFAPDAAEVIGFAGHSVLKSLGRELPVVPNITLLDSHEECDPIVKPGTPELRGKSDDSRYHLLGEIARGGMGAIIKGRDTDLGRDIAIKVLLDSHKDKPELILRFVEEAQIGGQLQHPGIVPVYELGQFGDQRPFFSMKLVKGKTFAELLAKRKEPSEDWPKLLGIFEQICQAMAYAHSRGVIHRDLKPANIMVGAFGEVQVMDWGLSKVLGQVGIAAVQKSLDKHPNVSVIETRRSVGNDGPGEVGSDTQTGSAMGTPAYMPPEQALGEIDRLDARADVFGLGAILAEILTGQAPYVGTSSADTFRMASRGKLDDCHTRLDASGADPQLIALAKTALSPEPEDRMRDAGELAEGVTKYLEGVQEQLKQTETARVQAQTRVEEERRRKTLSVAIAGLMCVVAVGGAVGSVLFKRSADTQKLLAQRANVTRLAGEAQRIAEILPIQSVLLAMEAVHLSDEFSLWPIPIVHSTLLEVVANLGGTPLVSLAGRTGPLTISQNDLLVTTKPFKIGSSVNKPVRVWNLNSRDPAAAWLELESDEEISVSSVAISDNGRRVLIAREGNVSVWELSANGDKALKCTELPKQDGRVAAQISPDGQWIVTATLGNDAYRGGVPGRVQVWRIDESSQVTAVGELAQSGLLTKEFAISPNNQWLAMLVGNEDEISARTILWNLHSTDIAGSVQSLEQHAGMQTSIAIGADSRHLVIGSSDGARLFDLTAKDLPASVRKLTSEEVRQVRISKDGRWLLVAANDSRLFDLSAPEPESTAIILRGLEASGLSVAISPNGRWLATGHKIVRIWDLNSIDPLSLPILQDRDGKSARLWDVNASATTGWTRVLRGHELSVSGLHFTADSRRLLTGSGDGSIRIWNADSENPGSASVLRGHKDRISVVAISPDLHWLATGSEDSTVRLWDLMSDIPSASSIVLPHQEFVRTMAISSDSHWLVTASGSRKKQSMGSIKEARVWDLTTADPSQSMRVLSGHESAITYVKISPDSRRVATLSYDGTARVWDLDEASPAPEPHVLSGHNPLILAVAFSPDSNTLLTGDMAGRVRLWDLTRPDPIEPKVLLAQDDWVLGLAQKANSVLALTGGNKNRKVRIWNLDPTSLTPPKSREVPTFTIWAFINEFHDHLMSVPSVVTADVWDLSRDRIVEPYFKHAHDGWVYTSVFSPDGSRFASAGEDGTVRISDLSTENPADTTLVLRGREYQVDSVAISGNNRWVLTGNHDNTARLWDMDIRSLMARARKLVGRELTDDERRTYAIPKRETPSPELNLHDSHTSVLPKQTAPVTDAL